MTSGPLQPDKNLEISQTPLHKELSKLSKSDSIWHGYLVAKNGELDRYNIFNLFNKGVKDKFQDKPLELDDAIVTYVLKKSGDVTNQKEIHLLFQLAHRIRDPQKEVDLKTYLGKIASQLEHPHALRATPNLESQVRQQNIHAATHRALKQAPASYTSYILGKLDNLAQNPNISQAEVSQLINKKFINSLSKQEDIKRMQELIESNPMVKNAVTSHLSQDIHDILDSSTHLQELVGGKFVSPDARARMKLQPYVQLSPHLVITELEQKMFETPDLKDIHKSICNHFFQSSSLPDIQKYLISLSTDSPGEQKTNEILFPLLEKGLKLEAQEIDLASSLEQIKNSLSFDTPLGDLLHYEQQLTSLQSQLEKYAAEHGKLYPNHDQEKLPLELELSEVHENISNILNQKAHEIDSQTNLLFQKIQEKTEELNGNPTAEELLKYEQEVILLKGNVAQYAEDFTKIFKAHIDANSEANKAKGLQQDLAKLEQLVNDKMNAKDQELTSYFENAKSQATLLENRLKEPSLEIKELLEIEKEISKLNKQVATFLSDYRKLTGNTNEVNLLRVDLKYINSAFQLQLTKKTKETDEGLQQITLILSNVPNKAVTNLKREINSHQYEITSLEKENANFLKRKENNDDYESLSPVVKEDLEKNFIARKNDIALKQTEILNKKKQEIPLTTAVGDKSHVTLAEIDQLRKDLSGLKQTKAGFELRPFANLISLEAQELDNLFLNGTLPAENPLTQNLNREIEALRNIINDTTKTKGTLYQTLFELTNPELKSYVIKALYPNIDSNSLNFLLKAKVLKVFNDRLAALSQSETQGLNESLRQAVENPQLRTHVPNTTPEVEAVEGEQNAYRISQLEAIQKLLVGYANSLTPINNFTLPLFISQTESAFKLIFSESSEMNANTVREFNTLIEPSFNNAKNKQVWAETIVRNLDVFKFQDLEEAAANHSILLDQNLNEILDAASKSNDPVIRFQADNIAKLRSQES